MMRASILAAITFAAIAFLAPHAASAGQTKYSGVHPIAASPDGGFCYIEFPHVHVYAPEKVDVLYRVNNDHHHFVGDPVAFGYEGPKHAYYGHHPVVIDLSVHLHVGEPATDYCYIDGPHYHGYQPPPDLTFTLKGDAYWYIGKFPPGYHKHKKRLVAINAVYKLIVYTRPVVVFDAPPVGYVGPVVEVAAPVVEVTVPPPRAEIEVHLPVPSLEINVGGGVIIDHRHRHRHRHGKHKKHKKFRKGWR